MHTPELQPYTVSKLFLALKEDVTQESLTPAAVWLIGELCSILMEQEMYTTGTLRDLYRHLIGHFYIQF